jgi:putative transposase
MSEIIHKRHNVSVLIYHIVCTAKYRQEVVNERVDEAIRDVCLELSKRYEIYFLEIGTDRDHVHFLVQSVPSYSPTKLVRTIKSITAREVFLRVPSVKLWLWGGEFWTKGYFISTVGHHGDEGTLKSYVKNQGTGKNYKPLHQEDLHL